MPKWGSSHTSSSSQISSSERVASSSSATDNISDLARPASRLSSWRYSMTRGLPN